MIFGINEGENIRNRIFYPFTARKYSGDSIEYRFGFLIRINVNKMRSKYAYLDAGKI